MKTLKRKKGTFNIRSHQSSWLCNKSYAPGACTSLDATDCCLIDILKSNKHFLCAFALRYMGATQHWLKTDIVNDEELRMIRAQVFEAIQRKRSELHREAAAVLRAERWVSMCTTGLLVSRWGFR